MKYYNPSNSQLFKTYNETKDWLDKIGVVNYEINKDTLIVDVSGNVDLSNKNLRNIPAKFGKVTGWFYVHDNPNLESLIGCPNLSVGLSCYSTGIQNFNGLGDVRDLLAGNIESIESFEGLPNNIDHFYIDNSCHNVNSLDYFPNIIKDRLVIGPDFKWFDSLYKHMEMCSTIYLADRIGKYSNILKLLYVKEVKAITSYTEADKAVANILNAEIKRQPDPRKRNLLKVAQELSNAGFHHLTV